MKVYKVPGSRSWSLHLFPVGRDGEKKDQKMLTEGEIFQPPLLFNRKTRIGCLGAGDDNIRMGLEQLHTLIIFFEPLIPACIKSETARNKELRSGECSFHTGNSPLFLLSLQLFTGVSPVGTTGAGLSA
jgi:hypothetical protein